MLLQQKEATIGRQKKENEFLKQGRKTGQADKQTFGTSFLEKTPTAMSAQQSVQMKEIRSTNRFSYSS